MILHIAAFAPLESAVLLFREQGTLEIFSPFLWFLLAAVCLLANFRPATRLATFAAALLLGLREMDLHKSLFGMSFLKTGFYRSETIALTDKLLGAAICLLLLILVYYLGKKFFTALRHTPRPWPAAYHYTILTLLLMVLSKFGDRLSAQLNKWLHIDLSGRLDIMIQSWEESTETVLPVLLCMAALLYQSKSNKQPD